jgi:hypothetical protein
MLCKGKTSKKKPCKAHAIAGGTVCRVHGGSAPQVMQAARVRLLAAADPLIARLLQIGLARGKDRKVEPQHSLAAIREALNRMGFTAMPAKLDAPAGDGTVLWDEFIQIHRRRVPATEE